MFFFLLLYFISGAAVDSCLNLVIDIYVTFHLSCDEMWLENNTRLIT